MRLIAILFAVFGIMISTHAMAWGENKLGSKFNAPSAKKDTYFRDKDHKIEGKYSEKFVLRHGQCGAADGYSDCLMDRGRVERQGNEYHGSEHWYRFSLFIDDTWPTDREYATIIIQSKVKNVRPPIWGFQLEHGNLTLIFHQLDQECEIASHSELLNKWTEIVLYANLGDKPSDLFNNPRQRAAIWINGKRIKAYCGYSDTGLVTPANKSAWKRHGSAIRYGIYSHYVSRDLAKLNPEIELPGWTDKHGNGNKKDIRSLTNDPWSIDWPVKYPTKTIWWDNMTHKKSKKNIWNMDMSIEQSGETNVPTVIMMTMEDGTKKPMKVLPHMKDHPNPKCKVGLILPMYCQ